MSEQNGVMMQYFHWYTESDGSLWNRMKDEAETLKEAGFTALWLPPCYKGAGGGYDVGYGVYDMYDLGEFDQKGSVRTKYGTRQELLEASQAAHDAGLRLYWDIVLNHRMGGDHEEEFNATPHSNNFRLEPVGPQRQIKAFTHFDFPGRQGKYSDFQWHWWHFSAVDYDANCPDSDDILLFDGKKFSSQVDLEKGSFDYLMGCNIDLTHDEVRGELLQWGEWFVDQVPVDGVRFDAVKHVEAGFFPIWLQHVRDLAQQPVFAVGEYWTYELEALRHFIDETGGNVALFDAPLHKNFAEASKAGENYHFPAIFDGTLVKQDPLLAVTIVANHDTQPLQELESVVEAWFKPLAYALILLRRGGYPCVFEADYHGAIYSDQGTDGGDYYIEMVSHKVMIDTFLGLRRTHAYGEQVDYFEHQNTIGWTRMGDEEHPGGIAVLMSNGGDGTKEMQTGAPDQELEDVTGHISERIRTDGDGRAEFRCLGGKVSVWIPVVE